MFPGPLFYILGFPVHAYGLIAAFSLLAGYAVTRSLLIKDNLPHQQLADLALWIILGGVLGARVLYVVQNLAYYLQNPMHVFYFQEGGLVQFGGVAAGILSGWLFCKKHNLPFARYSDAVAPGLSLGLALSRVGCLFSGCCFGRPTSMPWGIWMHGEKIHPTQIYSLLLELGVFAILILRKPKTNGNTFWLYLLLTALSRVLADSFRGGEQSGLHLPVLLGMAGLALFFLIRSQTKNGGNMKAAMKLGVIVLAALTLTACGIITTQKVSRGVDIRSADVNQIVKNQTTEKELIGLVGVPSKYRETENGKEFFYEFSSAGGPRWNLLFSVGGGSHTKTLYVWLDKNGVVTNYAFKQS